MPSTRRPHHARRARLAALVTVVCALVGAVGVATGAEAAPALRAATATSSAGVTTYRLGTLAFDGGGSSTTSTVGNGGRLVLVGSYSVRWSGDRAKPRVVLQRKVGAGRWTTTTAKVSLTDHGLVARTPALATKAVKRTVAYRLRSMPYATSTGTVQGTSMSRVVRVVVENQRRYTGLAKTVWSAVRAYCPATAVHVGSLGSKAGDYRTGALLLRIDAAVRGYRPIDVRSVALHECSHERQWLNYGGTTAGWQRMQKAAAARFGTAIAPVEHAADCGAQSVNPGGYLGYGGSCTAAELAAGKRLLHGHRY